MDRAEALERLGTTLTAGSSLDMSTVRMSTLQERLFPGPPQFDLLPLHCIAPDSKGHSSQSESSRPKRIQMLGLPAAARVGQRRTQKREAKRRVERG